MKMKHKAVMLFLTLLIFCVGSVCAVEPDNTTNTNLTDDQKVVNIVNEALEKKNAEIKALQDNDIKQSMEIQQLKDNNTQLDKRVKALEESNKQLVDSNKQLVDSNKVLNNTVSNQAVKINELKESNKQLVDSNKVLNNTVSNQAVKINELNNKLELQLIEINKLQGDKDKLQADIKQLNIDIKQLNAEKDSIYEKLLNSPKKEELDQLKKDIENKNKDITNKDKQINELNTKIDKLNNEIKTLKAINSISRNDVYNSLKALSSTNIQNIKCGKYTFKLEDYLKIPLIKNGKNDIIKFKKDNGRLPKYVMIAGYKVPKNVYQKLYNL